MNNIYTQITLKMHLRSERSLYNADTCTQRRGTAFKQIGTAVPGNVTL